LPPTLLKFLDPPLEDPRPLSRPICTAFGQACSLQKLAYTLFKFGLGLCLKHLTLFNISDAAGMSGTWLAAINYDEISGIVFFLIS